jgi:hypothetical protein
VTQQKLIDTRGKLVGFHGFPVAHARDKPLGMEFFNEHSSSNLLPASVVGVELIELRPRQSWGGIDSYVLYDRYGKILYQWPDDYIPHWLDVYEVCKSLGLL